MHYYGAPHERTAIIKSCIDIDRICQQDFIKNSSYYESFINKNALCFFHILVDKYKLVGEISNSPSLEYLFKLFRDNRNIILTDKELYDFSLPAEERFYYGLVLSSDEYNNIDVIKSRLIKSKSIL